VLTLYLISMVHILMIIGLLHNSLHVIIVFINNKIIISDAWITLILLPCQICWHTPKIRVKKVIGSNYLKKYKKSSIHHKYACMSCFFLCFPAQASSFLCFSSASLVLSVYTQTLLNKKKIQTCLQFAKNHWFVLSLFWTICD
jgi:hypothetical protein